MFPFLSTALAEEAAAAEEVVEAAPTWIGLGQNAWIVIIAVVMLLALLGLSSLTRKTWNAKSIAYGALCLALAYVLRYVKLFEMPQGGSVTLASMFPLMLFSAAYGVGPGMLLGAAYGFLRYLSGGWFVHPVQFLMDYPLAFGMIGLTGLYVHMPKKFSSWSLYACMVLGAIGRAASATLAGVYFWDTAFVPSLVYNGTYLIPDTIICMVIAVPLAHRLLKLMRKK